MANQRVLGTRRIWLPGVVMGLLAAVIVARLVELQVIEHERYAEQAREELQGSSTELARRGAIVDRNGHAFATSVDTWDIYVNVQAWTDPDAADRAANELAPAIGRDPGELKHEVLESGLIDTIVARGVDYETGRDLIDEHPPGVIALPNTTRVHPEGDLAAGLIGIFGMDNVGLSGIEAGLNDELHGQPGQAIFERDTAGEPIPFGQYVATESIPGKDIVLTIDRYLQRLAEQTLAEAIERHEAAGGTVVMMEPDTGEVLAMANEPSLKFSNLNLLEPGQVELMRNPAVTDMYEPGSVMKVITAAAALDAGMINPDTTYTDTGSVDIYDVSIRNWDYRTYGEETMTGVLQHSINTGSVFMADLLGADRFHSYLDAFGFSEPTGSELPGEASGFFRRPDDPGWSPVDLATQSFGQGINVTPLQMTSAFAATINGGKLLQSRFVKAHVNPNGEREDARPNVIGEPISEQTSATMRRMLEDVVHPDWHSVAEPQYYRAGGKSGTANIPVPGEEYDDAQVASYIGFAPVDDPKIVILVKLDDNADRLTGTQAAGPVFAELVDASLSYLNVPPDAAQYTEAR